MNNQTPEIRLAIEAGIKDALKKVAKTAGDARDGADPDQTVEGLVINMTLEIDQLKIGHDTDRAPTASIPLLPTLALLIKRMGATREAAMEMMTEVMDEALTLDKDATTALLEEQGVADAQAAIKKKVIGKLPRTKVKKMAKVKGVKLTISGAAQRSAA